MVPPLMKNYANFDTHCTDGNSMLETTNHTNLCQKNFEFKNGCCTGTEYIELPKMFIAGCGKVGVSWCIWVYHGVTCLGSLPVLFV